METDNVVCARCYSSNIGKIEFPSGRNMIQHREICGDCGFMIVADDSILRSVKLKKIMNNVLHSTR